MEAVWSVSLGALHERANAEVLRGLKTRTFKKKMEACGRGWHDELQSVLWSI